MEVLADPEQGDPEEGQLTVLAALDPSGLQVLASHERGRWGGGLVVL